MERDGVVESGLSPRVRGNPVYVHIGRTTVRSIPACAGEPPERDPAAKWMTVYPRVCGGTAGWQVVIKAGPGLSPRVRGNHRPRALVIMARGSIPACAGEPPPPTRCAPRRWVYPRVCGGTRWNLPDGYLRNGLSPRVRGNQAQGVPGLTPQGSIPACAGEPNTLPHTGPRPRVYPRVCGGTATAGLPPPPAPGLSPRVRGNPTSSGTPAITLGSIPACAGEPWLPQAGYSAARVYPRVCGGTQRRNTASLLVEGLSPRVRGNRPLGLRSVLSPGSIPACAGEPSPTPHPARARRVYPRVCGGTQYRMLLRRWFDGLSPRVRGNHWAGEDGAATARSIPACAGEPGVSGAQNHDTAVYPRVCGGTRG